MRGKLRLLTSKPVCYAAIARGPAKASTGKEEMFQINYDDGSPRVQVDRLPRTTGGAEIMLQTWEGGEIMSSLGLERDEALAVGRALVSAAGGDLSETPDAT